MACCRAAVIRGGVWFFMPKPAAERGQCLRQRLLLKPERERREHEDRNRHPHRERHRAGTMDVDDVEARRALDWREQRLAGRPTVEGDRAEIEHQVHQQTHAGAHAALVACAVFHELPRLSGRTRFGIRPGRAAAEERTASQTWLPLRIFFARATRSTPASLSASSRAAFRPAAVR